MTRLPPSDDFNINSLDMSRRKVSWDSIKKKKDNDSRSENHRWTRRLSFSGKLQNRQRQDITNEQRINDEDPVEMALFQARNKKRVAFRFIDDKEEEKKDHHFSDVSGVYSTKMTTEGTANFNIKSFMRKTLFNKKDSRDNSSSDSFDKTPLLWSFDDKDVNSKRNINSHHQQSFAGSLKTKKEVIKLLNKATRAHHKHFHYDYAIKNYIKALDHLRKFPTNHHMVVKTHESLRNAHHCLSSYNNSSSIVKMGVRYEDSGELLKALKMYTIAYRIRRDNLSPSHPSLIVLLNMLGNVQIKRGDYQEALQIYELALEDASRLGNEDTPTTGSMLLTRSISFRGIGTIHEKYGDDERALSMYHKGLDCVSAWKETKFKEGEEKQLSSVRDDCGAHSLVTSPSRPLFVRSISHHEEEAVVLRSGQHNEEMEVFIGITETEKSWSTPMTSFYKSFFCEMEENDEGPITREGKVNNRSKNDDHERDNFADVDIALTLHQIGQLYRKKGQYSMALDAYSAALRGMKYALGETDANVPAVLGNIGNLQKEMGDFDAAYRTYQQVLGLEAYRLGLSHPEIATSLHNIATIEAARGNYENALKLYRKVLSLQKKLFGKDHLSVATTSSCMGDVHEKLGDKEKAMEFGADALRIKMKGLGRHNIEVARCLNKLGKIALAQKDYNLADSYISKTMLIYRLNRVDDEHEWVVDAQRDAADIDAALVIGCGKTLEL